MVEGVRLESGYRTLNSIKGSNPFFSAMAVLDGELAVPCNSKPAIGRSKAWAEGMPHPGMSREKWR